jgi:hypothetical protein
VETVLFWNNLGSVGRTFGYTNTHDLASALSNWSDPAYSDAVNRWTGYDVRAQLTNTQRKRVYTQGDWRIRRHIYDGLGRLVGDTTYQMATQPSCTWNTDFGWICPPSGTVQSAATFSYDAVGNRTSQGGQYTPNGSRIQAFSGCTYTTQSDGTVSARSCSGTNLTFVWHAEERLAEIHRNGVVVVLHYDAFERLVRYDSAGAVRRHFLWDGVNLFAELDAAGNKVTEFSYYPGLDRLHAFVLASDSGTTYYAHGDAMGNVIALYALFGQGGGQVARTYEYDPWGQLTGGADWIGLDDRVRWKGARGSTWARASTTCGHAGTSRTAGGS